MKELIIKDKIEYSSLERKIVAVDAPNIIMSLFNFASPAIFIAGKTIDFVSFSAIQFSPLED